MKTKRSALLLRAAIAGALVMSLSRASSAADVVRYTLRPNNKLPLARAGAVPAGKPIYSHTGTPPAPLDPKATAGSPEYWGDTRTQALSAFGRLKESLDSLGLGFKDTVAMTVYLVGDP